MYNSNKISCILGSMEWMEIDFLKLGKNVGMNEECYYSKGLLLKRIHTSLQWRIVPTISLWFCTCVHHTKTHKCSFWLNLVLPSQFINISVDWISLMSNASAIMLKVAVSLAPENRCFTFLSLAQYWFIYTLQMAFYHRLIAHLRRQSKPIRWTRDRQFLSLPHPPILQHQNTRITSNYSLGACFRSRCSHFNPSVISNVILIRGRAWPNQCSKWIFRGSRNLEGSREVETVLELTGDQWLWRQGTEDSHGQSDFGLHIKWRWMGWEMQRETGIILGVMERLWFKGTKWKCCHWE